MKFSFAPFLAAFSIFSASIGHGDDWHQWRGPENNGVSSTAKPPLEWGEKKNLRWKAEIAGHGTGTPIVWKNKVFVTTAINTGNVDPSLPKPEDQPERVFGIKHPNTSYEMGVLCFDRQSGKQLWRKVATTLVPHEGHHKDASFASASPFCDGERLYCWFGSAGLFAFSLDGKKLWERELGKAKVGASLGEGSSPVVHEGKLILVRDHSGQSTIECLDAANGKTIWKKNRDEGNAWATPAIVKRGDRTQVITTASKAVRSYDLNTGDVIWTATGLTNNSTPCPIVEGDTVYCMTGYQGHALLAIPITGTGDVTNQIKWRTDRGTPYVPSPILYDGQLFFTQSNQGIMTSLRSADGKEVIERTRVPGLADIYASPVGADGRIYFVGRKGTTVVIEKGEEFKVLATNQLDDNFHASPALAGKQIFLRGMRFLYCLEEGGSADGSKLSASPKENAPPPADPKKALGSKLKAMVESGKISGKESVDLYLTAFPEEEENVKAWLAGLERDEADRKLLIEIAKRPVPKDYPGGGDGHQPFVDKQMKLLPNERKGDVGRLWKLQEKHFPDMENKGDSFIRILDYVRSQGKKPTPAPSDGKGKGKGKSPGNPLIKKQEKAEVRNEPGKPEGRKGSISGLVKNAEGKPMGGVMVSAFDDDRRLSVSVFSQPDGTFQINDLAEANYKIRARLKGQRDVWIENVKHGRDDIAVSMEPATGKELEEQRPATSAFAQLKFDSPRDRLNFKMMCSYCHQIGTTPFRTPEKPVDWETMITRMDGFGGLYPHTQETIVKKIIDTYKDDAVDSWPAYEPPPAPSGLATKAKITSWEMGYHYEGSFHDLEIGDDGLAYVVHIGKQYTATLDPKTTERIYYKLPRGSHGPHSIEPDNHGDMWLTLCASGEMAKFDLKTKEYVITSGAEAPAKRGSYPHTLRTDPKDPESLVWYTDAGRNSVFSLHPKTLKVKEYHLLEAGQVKAGGKGESRGITPYGLDYSPIDGTIWYTKLNGNRIGRIDPKAPDGDVTEWNPPFRGPRRLHVAPDGMVWVPGFGSGVFGKFDPNSEEWTTYPLPDYINQIPYALNVAPNGMVWICGTGNDTLYRFNPKTEYLVEFQLPYRGSYTREIEFDKDGNVWTSTSGPARHMENVCGTIIKLEILDIEEKELGGMKLAAIKLSEEEQGIATAEMIAKQKAQLGSLLAKIEARALPKDYQPAKHQVWVDRVMPTLTEPQKGRMGRLWNQRRKSEVPMQNPGQSFVRIVDYVVNGGSDVSEPAEPGPGNTMVHRLEGNKNRSLFDAFVYVNRIPLEAKKDEAPHLLAGRIHGRLANQEGRIQLKLPPGMDLDAYNGFKTFFGSEGNPTITNCAACHSSPDFSASESTLRNLKKTDLELNAIIREKMAKAANGNKDYAGVKIEESEINELVAFIRTLNPVSDERFRKLIINSRVTDVTKRSGGSPHPTAKQNVTPAKKLNSISGTVRFKGPRPERKPIRMDEASRKLYPKDQPALDESILVSKDGGLANVFVYVKNPPNGKWAVPSKPAVVDQQGSMFRPRVQGFRVGQKLVMKNGDPFVHNIRSLPKPKSESGFTSSNRPYNIVQPAGSEDREKTFAIAEGPVTIKCDFHPWMTAYYWIMNHPFFAVTDADGRFEISGLPEGEYELVAWHEKLGERVIEKGEDVGKIEFKAL